jgi:hypothetical protein
MTPRKLDSYIGFQHTWWWTSPLCITMWLITAYCKPLCYMTLYVQNKYKVQEIEPQIWLRNEHLILISVSIYVMIQTLARVSASGLQGSFLPRIKWCYDGTLLLYMFMVYGTCIRLFLLFIRLMTSLPSHQIVFERSPFLRVLMWRRTLCTLVLANLFVIHYNQNASKVAGCEDNLDSTQAGRMTSRS